MEILNKAQIKFFKKSRRVYVCVYLRSAGQCEQQVKCSLSEVEVVFGSQAELHGAEHRGQNRNLPHH